MGFLLMLGRRMRLRPKAETGLLLLLHEWTVNTQNTSILLTQAQRQRGSRRPASWIPRVELESTWPELLSVSESVPLRCWDGVRESGERSRKHFSSASSHQQDQSSNLEAGVTCTPPHPPPSVCRVFDLLSYPTVFRSHHACYFGAQYFQASMWKKYSWWWR